MCEQRSPRHDREFPRPRSVYLHVPFCRHRCGYCNFALEAGRDYLIDDFLDALQLEMHRVPKGAEVDTIYIGGGTPSHLPARQLARLLSAVTDQFTLADGAEVTLEANPIDLPGEIEAVLLAGPVTRISLGVQSFDHRKLSRLERDHTLDNIHSAVRSARRIVDNLSIDLIFGTPEETSQQWNDELVQALQLPVEHLSTYELTIEKGTQFWNRQARGSLHKPDDETCLERYRRTIQHLTQYGFQHYEVSSFAKPGYRSRHNQVYWSGQPYWAFGPGASSFVEGTRSTNHRSVRAYLHRVLNRQDPACEVERLSARQIAGDCLVFGIRLLEGVDLTRFVAETGFAVEEIAGSEPLDRLREQGLLAVSDNRLHLTDRGLVVCDSICAELVVTDK